MHVVFKTAILTYHSVLDAITRQTVREEMRRSPSLVSERVASMEVELSDSATTGPTREHDSREKTGGVAKTRVKGQG